MGLLHFNQMLEEAELRDRRAFPLAYEIAAFTRDHPREMAAPISTHRQRWVNSSILMWDRMKFAEIMRTTREMLELQDGFTAEMQELLVIGKITVRAFTQQGKPMKVREPAVFSYDDPVMSRIDFHMVINDRP